MHNGTRRTAFIAVSRGARAIACALGALAMLAACGGPGPMSRSGTSAVIAPTKISHRIPKSFFSVANYSPHQIAYGGDLNRFKTKWWLGGYALSDPANQTAMLRHGYHFLPSFNTGYPMRANGLTSLPASTSKPADPHSCIDTICALNNSAILAEVQGVQGSLGSRGNYYSVGNEVDNYSSDDVSPAVYVGQFDAWLKAIKQVDSAGKIVAPNISSFSCCTTAATSPFGTAGDWFRAFVSEYKRQHGGVKPPIDVLGMHLYNFGPTTGVPSTAQIDNYLSEVRSFRQEADGLGYAHIPIWITEMGFIYYPTGQPLSFTQGSQIARALGELANNASVLKLQRLFLFTNNQPAALNIGVRPLYDPTAPAGPASPLPLSDYGQLVAKLASEVP